jgi:hypothetical protein
MGADLVPLHPEKHRTDHRRNPDDPPPSVTDAT